MPLTADHEVATPAIRTDPLVIKHLKFIPKTMMVEEARKRHEKHTKYRSILDDGVHGRKTADLSDSLASQPPSTFTTFKNHKRLGS